MRFDLQLLDFVECEKEFDKLAVCGSDKDLTWSELKNEVDSFKKKLLDFRTAYNRNLLMRLSEFQYKR